MPDVLFFFLIFVLVNTTGSIGDWKLRVRQDSFLGPLLLSEKTKTKNKKKTEPGNEVGLNFKRCFLFLSRISEKKI